MSLFITDRTNEYGIFCIKTWKNGEQREVIIDDFFPCTDDGYVCFSKANGNELWVLILEKAFAKLHGSYERIEGGYAHFVMRDLTGAPSYELCLEEDTFDIIWKQILESDEKGYCMAASAGLSEGSAELLESLGLVAQHSYGLLKVKEATDEFGDKICLL